MDNIQDLKLKQDENVKTLPPLDKVTFWASLSHNHLISSGLLIFCAVLALIIANSKYGNIYHHYLDMQLGVELGSVIFDKSLHHLINDGLMSIFFFMVGA